MNSECCRFARFGFMFSPGKPRTTASSGTIVARVPRTRKEVGQCATAVGRLPGSFSRLGPGRRIATIGRSRPIQASTTVFDPSRSYSYAEADVQLREEAFKAARQTDSYFA